MAPMKKVVFAFIVLLLFMAAVVVMWGQIHKVLMGQESRRTSGVHSASPAEPGA